MGLTADLAIDPRGRIKCVAYTSFPYLRGRSGSFVKNSALGPCYRIQRPSATQLLSAQVLGGARQMLE